MRRTIEAVVVCFWVAAASFTMAQDTSLTIEQVPEEKQRQLQEDAQDEGLLPPNVPERCADSEVAATDPVCVSKEEEDVSRSFGLPVIEDPMTEDSELIPGATINQSRPSQ